MSKRWLAAIFGAVFSLVALTACSGGETEGDSTEVIDMEEPTGEEAPVSGQPEPEIPAVGEGETSEDTENSDETVPTTPEGQLEVDPSVESEFSTEPEEPLEDPTSETELNLDDGAAESDSTEIK